MAFGDKVKRPRKFGDRVKRKPAIAPGIFGIPAPEVYMNEYHDLPSTKTAKDCWISVDYNWGIAQYHYTSIHPGNLGCYLIEYVSY